MKPFADISVVVAPMLAGMNKAVFARGTIYVPPEVYDLMTDGTETLELVLKHLPLVRLPDSGALTRMALLCLTGRLGR